MSVELGLTKINTLEKEKKNLLLKFIDANELLNSMKIKNMSLIEKVKSLEYELSIAREQIDRSSTSKLDHLLSVQKSPFDKLGLGFVESIFDSVSHFTKFFPSLTEPKLDVRNPKEELLATRKIRVDLRESKPKNPNQPKG